MKIRSEKPDDHLSIQLVNELAFGQTDEAELVNRLRDNSGYNPELSLIGDEDGRIIGHILFSPISIVNPEQKHAALALAPMAVLPEYQGKGAGSALVTNGLEVCRMRGHRIVVVLGHPEYYPRFGFVPAEHYGIFPPVKEWSSAFFVRELVSGGLKGVSGIVEYPPEFGI